MFLDQNKIFYQKKFQIRILLTLEVRARYVLSNWSSSEQTFIFLHGVQKRWIGPPLTENNGA